MGSFANGVFSLLLSWLQGAASSLWETVSSGRMSPFWQWFGEHWKTVAVALCAAGLLVDLLVYLFRWKPYRVWQSGFQRIRGRKRERAEAQSLPAEEPVPEEIPVMARHERRAFRDGELSPDREETAPPRKTREELEQTLRHSRRRVRMSGLFSEQDDSLYESLPPQELFDRREAYGTPVYPSKWKTDEDEQE